MTSKIAFFLLKDKRFRKILLIAFFILIFSIAVFVQASTTKTNSKSGRYGWPISEEYPLDTSDEGNLFGERVHPIYGDVRMHTGVDIQAPNGSDCFAIGDGTVIQTGDAGGWGYTIQLDVGKNSQGQELTCTYCHLEPSGISVNVGDSVKRGQKIAVTGTTGTTQGGHIHFEMKEDGIYCDPMKYIGIGGGSNEEIIWNYLKSQGLSDVCVAGIMGNIEAESGYDPTAIEGNGIGHGLCQWSFGRWENLSSFATSQGKDWSDINLQLDYFWSEIPSYESRLSAAGFYTQTDINTATKIFCDIFEAPNEIYANYNRRYEAAQTAYSQFAGH